MATLNLSTNGPSIKSSYQKVVDAPPPSGSAASSSTYAQWAVYSVQAPLVSAFQQESGKESVLKVQSTGEGELVDLIEDFSEGRIQFAFVKVKDPNTGLPKSALIAWCGEGVPERTKGYFTTHLAAVSKLLHGYHVQITARSDRDLTPESIVQKVADASGAKYGGGSSASQSLAAAPPPVASKPVFMPSRVGGGGGAGFNPLSARSRGQASSGQSADNDGWGEDAPQVTRTQLEKVGSAYKPTKVNMAELTNQKQEPSRFQQPQSTPSNGTPDVVRGAYQPIGKVDIAALRREAQEKGQLQDERPSTVKGSYEPIGKVDIAAIKAKAQPLQDTRPTPSQPSDEPAPPKSLAERSAAFQPSERLTSMPKPKVANRFGSQTGSFAGTKAHVPGGFEAKPVSTAAPVGAASRTFADEGGKTPAQIWAEKKARERGTSDAAETSRPSAPSPMQSQQSGSWQSGYAGKKWGSVQTTKTGTSHTSAQDNEAEEPSETPAPSGGVSSIANRFKDAPPMGAANVRDDDDDDEPAASAPPPMDLSSKPSAGPRGVPMPGLPSRPAAQQAPEAPEEPEDHPAEEHVDLPPPPPFRAQADEEEEQEEEDESHMQSGSPPRIAMPVSRSAAPQTIHTEEPAALPAASLSKVASQNEQSHAQQDEEDDAARGAGETAAQSTFGAGASAAAPGASVGGKRALVQYDYEKAEENELELREGDYVDNIEMVDEDWWMGQNSAGETGLFPSNYVELVEDEGPATGGHAGVAPAQPQEDVAPSAGHAGGSAQGATATAQYEYEAAEENELSFPDGATITNVEFPDEDWWLGEYNGEKGLFPSNYVQLDE